MKEVVIPVVNYLNDHKDLYLKGVTATALNVIPLITEINEWLEAFSLLSGIVLSWFLIYKVIVDVKKKKLDK